MRALRRLQRPAANARRRGQRGHTRRGTGANGAVKIVLLAGPTASGTGRYFKALTEGLATVPPVPAEVRNHIREESSGETAEALHRRLAALDPEDARRIRPSDRARIVRALEVFEATGRSLAAWHE